MKIGTILKAIYWNAGIHVCLAVFFALCWFFHHLARLTIEIKNHNADWRESDLTNDRMMKATAMVDWVAAHESRVVLVFPFTPLRENRSPPSGWERTFTSKLSSKLGTQQKRAALKKAAPR